MIDKLCLMGCQRETHTQAFRKMSNEPGPHRTRPTNHVTDKMTSYYVVVPPKMEPSEVEFLAEDEVITIIPKFSESRISLLSVSIHFCSLALLLTCTVVC